MKVLIAGCGDLGTRLGLRLVDHGHAVWGLRRRPERLPAAIRGLAGDLATADGLPALPAVDLVVYAAAADRRADEAYRAAYVDGVRHLLAALRDRALKRWLHVSSTAVYAQVGGAWVDESSATLPEDFGGQRILQGERLLAASDVASTILRLSGIYGPRRTRLLDQVRRGEAICYQPPVYTNRIHVDDAVGALVHLAGVERPEKVYLGVDHEPVTDGRVKRWLAKRLGVDPPPDGPRPAGGRRARSNKRCSNHLLVASGYRFLHPDYRSGYGSLIDSAGRPTR